MSSRKAIRHLGAALLLALVVAGCTGGAPPSAAPTAPNAPTAPPPPTAPPAPTTPPTRTAELTPTLPPAAPTPTPATRPPLSQSRVRFAIGVSSGLQVLPQLALEAGYFRDEGLEVSITHLQNDQNVVAALTSGDLEMANGNGPGIIQAHLSGLPVAIVATPVTRPIFDLVVPTSVTRPEDLVGKTVAVTVICDSTCFQVSRVLRSWGLRPQQDVQLLGLRDYPGLLAGLTSGQVGGAALPPPYNFQAQQQGGFHSLADLSQLPVEYPTANVQTSQRFATEHPDTVLAFLRAYVRAIRRYKADRDFTVQVYRGFLQSDDTPVLERTWEFYARLLQSDPSPTVSGMQSILDSLTEGGDQRTASANPNDFILPAFMQELRTSGFLDS
jgi:ABC-type nitrate/sulfonate/bicarbonate transport system substrate-binding protein